MMLRFQTETIDFCRGFTDLNNYLRYWIQDSELNTSLKNPRRGKELLTNILIPEELV